MPWKLPGCAVHSCSPARLGATIAVVVLGEAAALRAELRFHGALPAISTHSAVPYGVATADLDHDGIADLIVATDAGTQIRLGLGQGLFRANEDYATGSGSAAVAVADFDADGHADLVVGHSGSPLSILLGRGDGSFELPVATPFTSSSIAVGELNGDAFLDIAVARRAPHSFELFSVLFGNGDGTFRPGMDLTARPGAAHVALGDVNTDGRTDIVVGNWLDASISVLLNLGDGTFTPQTRFEAGVYCRVAALGDLNHDGHLDVVAMDAAVSVLIGNGDGTFGNWRLLGFPRESTGTRAASIAIADLDSDGNPDIAVSDQGNYDLERRDFGSAVLHFGAGDGTFPRARKRALGLSPYFVHIAELNGDENPDLLVANGGSRSVSVLLGRGGESFGPSGLPMAGSPVALTTADLDADGIPDLAVANETHNLSVMRGQENGGFTPRLDYSTGRRPIALHAGDTNGDGHLDLVAACRDTQTISVLLGGGDGTFGQNTDFGTGANTSHLALGDFLEDGHLDAAVLLDDKAIGILPGSGDGLFGAPIRLPLVPSGYSSYSGMSTGDLNRDSHLDFVISHYENEIRVYLGRGDGSILPSTGYPAVENPGASAITDLDGDGNNDVIATVVGGLLVFPGDGAGGLQTPIRLPVSRWPGAFAVGDLNGDGSKDLVCSNDFGFAVVLSVGGFVFRDGQDYETGRGPTAIALTDMDQNGALDVVVTSRQEREVFVLLNKGPTAVTVTDLVAQRGPSGVLLTWSIAQAALGVLAGVSVQRAPSESGPYVELTEWLEPALEMSFMDAGVDARRESWYRLVVEHHDGSRLVAGPARASPFGEDSQSSMSLAASELESGDVSIRYRIGIPSDAVSLEIFDVRGRRVRRLVSGPHVPGEYKLLWNRSSAITRAGRGVYFVQLTANRLREARKLALLRE